MSSKYLLYTNAQRRSVFERLKEKVNVPQYLKERRSEHLKNLMTDMRAHDDGIRKIALSHGNQRSSFKDDIKNAESAFDKGMWLNVGNSLNNFYSGLKDIIEKNKKFKQEYQRKKTANFKNTSLHKEADFFDFLPSFSRRKRPGQLESISPNKKELISIVLEDAIGYYESIKQLFQELDSARSSGDIDEYVDLLEYFENIYNDKEAYPKFKNVDSTIFEPLRKNRENKLRQEQEAFEVETEEPKSAPSKGPGPTVDIKFEDDQEDDEHAEEVEEDEFEFYKDEPASKLHELGGELGGIKLLPPAGLESLEKERLQRRMEELEKILKIKREELQKIKEEAGEKERKKWEISQNKKYKSRAKNLQEEEERKAEERRVEEEARIAQENERKAQEQLEITEELLKHLENRIKFEEAMEEGPDQPAQPKKVKKPRVSKKQKEAEELAAVEAARLAKLEQEKRNAEARERRARAGRRGHEALQEYNERIGNNLGAINPAYQIWWNEVGKNSPNPLYTKDHAGKPLKNDHLKYEKVLEYLQGPGASELERFMADRAEKADYEAEEFKSLEDRGDPEFLAWKYTPEGDLSPEFIEWMSKRKKSKKTSTINFLKELKKVSEVTNNPYLMASMIAKYSESLEDTDPKASIKLLQIADGIING